MIQQRIATYEAETKPILDYYSEAMVTDIDATQPPVKVLHDIIGKITKLEVYSSFSEVKV